MKLNLRSVDLNLLTVFLAVLDEGQLSRAAEKLGMSQPAMSNAIQRLRVTLGDKLFIRNKGGMVPTTKALALREPVQEALFLLEKALSPAEEFSPKQSERQFRFVLGEYAEAIWLPRWLILVAEQAPGVKLASLGDGGAYIDGLINGDVDFAVDYLPPSNKRLDYCILEPENIVVMARKGHPRVQKTLNRTAYLEEQHITLPVRENRRRPLELALGGARLPRKVLVEVQQFASMPLAVAVSDALATLPERLAQQYQHYGDFQFFDLPWAQSHDSSYYLIWAKHSADDEGHSWFRKEIVERSVALGEASLKR